MASIARPGVWPGFTAALVVWSLAVSHVEAQSPSPNGHLSYGNQRQGKVRVAQSPPTRVMPGQPAGTALPGVEAPAAALEASTLPFLESPVPPSVQGPAMDAPTSQVPQGVWQESGPPVLDGQPLSIAPYNEACDGAGLYGGPEGDPAAPIYSTGTWHQRGNFYFQGDFLYWTKTNVRRVQIAQSEERPFTLPSGGVVPVRREFFAGEAPHRYAPGARFTVGSVLGRDAALRDHSVEFVFAGFLEWNSILDIRSAPTPQSANTDNIETTLDFLDATTPPFNAANAQEFTYDSDFNSFELNYLVKTRPGRDQMALQPDGSWVRFKNSGRTIAVSPGLRYIMVNERTVYTSQNAANTNRGRYQVSTNNDLFGPQIGLSLDETYDRWNWGMRSRLGGLMNFADRGSIITTDVGGTPGGRSEKSREEQLSFNIEVGGFLSYQIRPNQAFRCGYELMYLTGLVIAPENMSLQPEFSPINTTGDHLYHGGFFGYELYW